jgi:hypothetical protein
MVVAKLWTPELGCSTLITECNSTYSMRNQKVNFAVPNIYRTFAVVNINDMETQAAYTNSTETMRTPRTRRVAKAAASNQTEMPKTPESELMSVDEYFGILHRMVDEYYDSIQG